MSDPRVEIVAEMLHSLYCNRRLPPHGDNFGSDGLDEENARLILAALDIES